MRESRFGFRYSWSDLQPIRALSIVAFAVQFVGVVLGYLFPRSPYWFESVWFGGAIATFPGFLLGLLVQYRYRPGSISANKLMVQRLGVVAGLFTLVALAMLGFGR